MATCGQECMCSAFRLGGTEPNLFATPQARWLGMPWTFIFYRFAMATYQLTFFILTIVYWGEAPFYNPVDTRGKWVIFVSNWTYILVTAYLLMAAITTLYWHLTRRRRVSSDSDKQDATDDIELNTNNPQATSVNNLVAVESPTTPWYFQLQRFFHVYACSASLMVTILYWVLDYTPGIDIVNVFGVHVHGVAAFLMILDTMLIATPFRILHMVYVMIVAAAYFCFTAIYWAAGGTNPSGNTHIYSGFLDWGSAPGTSAVVAVITVFIATPILHLIFYALYQLRLTFGRCCSCCTYQES